MRTPKPAPLALLTAAALAAAAATAARAEPRPLWEFGLGAGALVFNDYRGADTVHAYPVPVPYLVYRGKFLRADHNGLRGRLFDQDRVELNLSVNGTTPVRSDSARHGMPDLRPTLEVGPSLDVHLWKSADARVKLDLRLPARAAPTARWSGATATGRAASGLRGSSAALHGSWTATIERLPHPRRIDPELQPRPQGCRDGARRARAVGPGVGDRGRQHGRLGRGVQRSRA